MQRIPTLMPTFRNHNHLCSQVRLHARLGLSSPSFLYVLPFALASRLQTFEVIPDSGDRSFGFPFGHYRSAGRGTQHERRGVICSEGGASVWASRVTVVVAVRCEEPRTHRHGRAAMHVRRENRSMLCIGKGLAGWYST